MTAARQDGSFPSAARWVCVAVLGGLGAIGVGRGLMTSAESPAPVETRTKSAPITIPARPAQTITSSEPTRSIVEEPKAQPETSAEPVASEATMPEPGIQKLINVNTATAAELELLPGVGPVMAGRIIEDRQTNGPFRTPADLDRVKGIGPKTLEKLTPLVRFE